MLINCAYTSVPQCRRKKYRKGAINILKKAQKSIINNTIVPFYLQDSPLPHCIIELSLCEVKKLRKNIIHLGDVTYHNDLAKKIVTSYANISYGDNIKSNFHKKYHKNDRYDLLNIHKMSRNFMAITKDKYNYVNN